jgi:hypothetical protein
MRGVRSKISDKNNQEPEERFDTTSLRAFEEDVDNIILVRWDKREAARTSREPDWSPSKQILMIDASRDDSNSEATKGPLHNIPLHNIPEVSAFVSNTEGAVREMRDPALFEQAATCLQAVKDGISGAFVSTMEAYDGGVTVCMDYGHRCGDIGHGFGDIGGTSSDISSLRLGSVMLHNYKRKEMEVLAANADIKEASPQENLEEETIDHRGREKSETSSLQQFWKTFLLAF